MADRAPKIVIVGGGFGGLATAKALRKAPAEVALFDRNNHHVFQPLLYQVATAVLAPAQIASPIRGILGKHLNTTVILGEVTGVDKDHRCIIANSSDRQGVRVDYDYLILATGATHSYFGRDEFAQFAPGLKALADAESIRNKILKAFEQAEAEDDPKRHQDLLTFILVGAGPTGVEMAAAIAVLVRSTLKSEFRRVDPMSARILLVDRNKRVLGTFSDHLSARAKKRLENLGVDVRLECGVDEIDADGVVIAGERIPGKTIIWTAGVAPSPAGKWLGAPTDHAGRVLINEDLTVPGHPEVFVIGDTASLSQDGKPLPGVAQVAIQQGHYVGNLIRRRLEHKSPPRPFRYFDKGNMAVIGRGYAVLQSGKLQLSGLLAFLAWAFIHLRFLAQRNLRFSVFMAWTWSYFTGGRGARIIVNPHTVEPVKTTPAIEPDKPAPSQAPTPVTTSHS
jgi:NADH dehydrogenase